MFNIFFELKSHFRKHAKGYFFGILFLIITSAISLLPPQIISYFINLITTQKLDQPQLIIVVVLAVATTLFGYLFGMSWIFLIYNSGQKYDLETRKLIHHKILRVDNDFFVKFKVGDVITRLTSDLKNVTLAAGEGVFFTVDAISFIFLTVIAMYLTTNLTLTLIVLIPLILLSVSVNFLGNKIGAKYDLVQSSLSKYSSNVLQSINGIKMVMAYNQQEYQDNHLKELANDIYDKSLDLDRLESVVGPIYRIFYGLIYTVSITYGIYLVMNQEITIGQLVAFNLYIGILEWPIYALQLVFGTLQRGNISIKRVNELTEYQQSLEHDGILKIDEIEEIHFKDFSYAYLDNNVLHNINLKIKKNEIIGIIGPIGSGKSTLIKQLLFLYQPNYKGQIKINNQNINDLNKENYLSKIAYVSQETKIFAKTIRENIQMNQKDLSDEEIMVAVRHADLEKDLLEFEFGLDTVCGEKGVTLSGGQQQRLCLARALARKSEILILDDVFAAVDITTEQKIIDNLYKYYKDQTIIIISHRLSCLDKSDYIYAFDNGQIIESGTPIELLNSNGYYYNQYQLQNKRGA